MKKIKIVFLSLVLFFGLALMAQSFWKGKTLSANEVKKKWGSETFDKQKFKNADMNQKAKMAYNILNDKKLIGQSLETIRKDFGPPDGFYFIDSYPAYIIQEGKNRTEETWQIVFKLNEKYEVRDIIVHKNCCD